MAFYLRHDGAGGGCTVVVDVAVAVDVSVTVVSVVLWLVSNACMVNVKRRKRIVLRSGCRCRCLGRSRDLAKISDSEITSKRVKRTILVIGVSIQEQAVLNALLDLERLEVQEFHFDDWVLLLFFLLAPAVTVTVVVVVLNDRCQHSLRIRKAHSSTSLLPS